MSRFGPDTDNYILGKGKVYFDRLDSDGNRTGEIDLGNTPAFTLTPSIESLDHYESMSGIREKDKSVDTSIGFTGTFTLDEYARENLKLALMNDGGEASYTQVTGHQTNEPITARLGKWVPLSKRNVHAVNVTDSTGTVTYVADTDYAVDASIGRIRAIPGGSISDAQALLVDYNYDATEYPKVSALSDSTIEGYVRFVGAPAVGPTYELEIWRVKIKPSGDIPWITEEWGQIPFEMEVLKDAENHPSEPWFILIDKTTNEATQS